MKEDMQNNMIENKDTVKIVGGVKTKSSGVKSLTRTYYDKASDQLNRSGMSPGME